jgi:hypothetical protein
MSLGKELAIFGRIPSFILICAYNILCFWDFPKRIYNALHLPKIGAERVELHRPPPPPPAIPPLAFITAKLLC